MQALTVIARAMDRLFGLIILAAASLSVTSIFVMALLMAINVVSRQAFNRPFLDTVQLGELSVVIMTFMGFAWVYRLGRHVSVGIVVDHLPWKPRLWVENFVSILSLIGVGVAIYETWQFAYASLVIGERLRGIFRVDAFPFHALMPLGLLLLELEITRAIILNCVALARNDPLLAYDSRPTEQSVE